MKTRFNKSVHFHVEDGNGSLESAAWLGLRWHLEPADSVLHVLARVLLHALIRGTVTRLAASNGSAPRLLYSGYGVHGRGFQRVNRAFVSSTALEINERLVRATGDVRAVYFVPSSPSLSTRTKQFQQGLRLGVEKTQKDEFGIVGNKREVLS